MTNCTGTATSNVRTSRPPKTWCRRPSFAGWSTTPGRRSGRPSPPSTPLPGTYAWTWPGSGPTSPSGQSDRQTPDPTGDWAEKWDLERVLARLPQEDQTLLLLRYANQVPVQALSKLTGLSRFAIYRKCTKLLAWCKDALREEESP